MEKYKDNMGQLVPQPDRFLVRDQALSRRLRAGHQMCGEVIVLIVRNAP
jgi:hypothetical protein